MPNFKPGDRVQFMLIGEEAKNTYILVDEVFKVKLYHKTIGRIVKESKTYKSYYLVDFHGHEQTMLIYKHCLTLLED